MLSFVYSSKVTDLAGDVVYPNGIDFTNYLTRNPLILLQHDMSSWPIGKTRSMSVQGDDLIGTIEFFTDLDAAGIGEKARAAMELVKRRTMGISITFLPKEFALNDSDGINFYKSYMIEASVCSVPCCPTAYALSGPVSNSADAVEIEALEMELDLVQQVLDSVTKIDRQRCAAKRRRAIMIAC